MSDPIIHEVMKYAQLQTLANDIKARLASKVDLNKAADDAAAAIKSGKVEGHTVKLFTSTDKTGTPAFSFDFPTEMFLDQAKTTFVPKFNWSAETYPGSTNPNLQNKPVMVLAVRGDADGDSNADNDTLSYSFLNMATLVDTYAAKAEGKDASTTVTISGYEVDVKVNVSEAEGNLLSATDDGLFVGHDSTKVDKVTTAVANNIALFAQNGALADSGKTLANIIDEQPLAIAPDPANEIAGNKGLMSAADKAKLNGITAEATKVENHADNGAITINGTKEVVFDDSHLVRTDQMVAITDEQIHALFADIPVPGASE